MNVCFRAHSARSHMCIYSQLNLLLELRSISQNALLQTVRQDWADLKLKSRQSTHGTNEHDK